MGNHADDAGPFAFCGNSNRPTARARSAARHTPKKNNERNLPSVRKNIAERARLVHRLRLNVVAAPRVRSPKYGDVVSWNTTRHHRQKFCTTFQTKIAKAPPQLRTGLHIQNGKINSRKESTRYVKHQFLFTLSHHLTAS